MDRIAQYHLPGLFEFYELYRVFLPLYCTHRDWFYPWCDIASLYNITPDFWSSLPVTQVFSSLAWAAAGMSARGMRWHWHRNTASRPG